MAARQFKEVTLTYRKPLYKKVCPECGESFYGSSIQVRCSRKCTARVNARVGRQRAKELEQQPEEVTV